MNYDLEKLEVVYRSKRAAQEGVERHEFAAAAIRLKQMLQDTGQTLNSYVNDAIGFRMDPEVTLYFAMDAFGTADAIGYNDNILRIHDLKTGITEASFRQLEGYAAYFCLEYRKNPFDFDGMEFRIYQNDEIKVMIGDPHSITQIMETVKVFAPKLQQLRSEVK